MVTDKLKKGIIAASLLFLAFGCSGSRTIKAAALDESTPTPVSQMEIAEAEEQIEETEALDTDIPEGKYECRDVWKNRVTSNSFYLFADGSYQRIDGQKGFYSHRPIPDMPTSMHITWTSGPNRKWDNSSYINWSERPIIGLYTKDRSSKAPVEESCRLAG